MNANLPLWTPTQETLQQCQLQYFQDFIRKTRGLTFPDYAALHRWSISDLAAFWESIAQFFSVDFDAPYSEVIQPQVPFYRTQWFQGATLSYAQHIERNFEDGATAIVYAHENGDRCNINWNALLKRALAIKEQLEEAGVGFGDCVGGYMPYHPESIAAFLAVNSLGAVWSCCSPDFGIDSVVRRLGPLHPKALLSMRSYSYQGKSFDLKEKTAQLVSELPSLAITLTFSPDWTAWEMDTKACVSLHARTVPFDHPIWVLFSSGTTGAPKAITHRTGGMLLEQLKALALHQNVQQGERFFWHTTTGWMMWNYALGALLCGATLCIYDGAPNYPDEGAQWRFAAEHSIHHFGHGAPFFNHAMKMDVDAIDQASFSHVKTIGATGAPLSEDTFRWLQKKLPHVQVVSLSGGTDVCSAFIGGNPQLPVYAGYLQCPMLGAAVAAWNPQGISVTTETAELVLTQPMPCMPVYFWNDTDFSRYHSSYFEVFEGVWTHGDWIYIDPEKGIKVLGRSDATLNRNGIRIGTAELYQALDTLSFLQDHLMVDIPDSEGSSQLLLFVIAACELTEEHQRTIRQCLRHKCSPRHAPDQIFQVKAIPYTLSGKKLEIPVKKIMMGTDPKQAAQKGALRNPESLTAFQDIYRLWLANM